MAIDISKIIESCKETSSNRYIIIQGEKVPPLNKADFSDADFKDIKTDRKDKIAGIQLDFSKLDIVLENLHTQWVKESDPIKKEILLLRYDLEVESFGFKDSSAIKSIREMQNKLNKYLALLDDK